MRITHTAMSMRFGLHSPERVLQFAAQWGSGTRLILAEVNGAGGWLPALRQSEIPLQPAVDWRQGGIRTLLLLPRSMDGYAFLMDWVSRMRGEHRAGDPSDWLQGPLHPDVDVVFPVQRAPKRHLSAQEWLGVSDFEQLRAQRHPQSERALAWKTCAFARPEDPELHRVLRAVDRNGTLANLPPEAVLEERDPWWEPLERTQSRFEPWIWRQSERFLAELPDWRFDSWRGTGNQNQSTYTGRPAKDRALLRMLCEDALPDRYPGRSQDPVLRARLDKELDLIQQKDFVAYFLLNWDIVRYAQKQNFFYVGRGSGANSIVAYLLKITNVDPIELDLYFERFINLYRSAPPDFDIDFSWRDRPRLTEYIFTRFPHTALLGAVSTFQHRAVVRELGKVWGLPKSDIDELADGKLRDRDETARTILRYGQHLHGLPNRMTLHSSGILIANAPLTTWATTFMPPKGFPTVDLDMHTAEDVGLHKFDILGQRGLSKISETLSTLHAAGIPTSDIHDSHRFKNDPHCLELLRNGGAMGCFYVESPAMRMLMTKLQTSNYLELVAASSVIRPGVSSSGMMKAYIDRHRNPALRAEANSDLLRILPETYGVMVYQEDVIRVAHEYAGLTLAEADVLRRGMSGKFRSRAEFHAVETQFFANCAQRGHAPEAAREIWRQIESFAGYAFAKGHSASYAVESFQSLYLKAYFPIPFMVANVNNGGGYYRAEHYLNEARRHGARIEPPCVNEGRPFTVLRSGIRVILGTDRIRSFDAEFGRQIDQIRQEGGPFLDLDDFIDRLHCGGRSVPLDSVLLLIRAEAFRFTGRPARTLLWAAHRRLGHRPPPAPGPSLFDAATAPKFRPMDVPTLETSPLEQAYEHIELFGFPLCDPFSLFEIPEVPRGIAPENWPDAPGQTTEILGYLVSLKNTKTVRGDWMQIGTFEDRRGSIFDVVLFPPAVARHALRRRGVYHMSGRISVEYGYASLDVHFLERCPAKLDPRFDETPAHLMPVATKSGRGMTVGRNPIKTLLRGA
ncbi:MAG: DNA polymerase III subunit alpha [Schleiferiaceae bacterium]